MGFTPQEVDRMSWWQYQACVDGYTLAHSNKDTIAPPSDEEFFRAVNGED